VAPTGVLIIIFFFEKFEENCHLENLRFDRRLMYIQLHVSALPKIEKLILLRLCNLRTFLNIRTVDYFTGNHLSS
jgi:hypothetical protein